MVSVVGAKGGMVMDDAVVVNGCAHNDVPSSLSRDFDDGMLANDIPSPSLSFHKVETNLIGKDQFMLHCSCIKLKNSLKQAT